MRKRRPTEKRKTMKKQIVQDCNGNELTYFAGMWWSKNFDRFWQLVSRRDGPPVLTCRLYPGMQPHFMYSDKGKRRLWWWNKWRMYGWAFFDPDTQTVYPGEREIDENAEEDAYYAKKSIS